jgi:ATP-dependent helicase/nuclease subunit B
MKPRLHHLSWDQPLLPQAVAWLAGDWSGAGVLDLSALLVIVPTRQSGRRLREALAAHAAAHGQAVFPPRVVLPESLALLGASEPGVAPRSASQLAWIRVLRGAALEDFRAVFPIDPPGRDFTWARRLADQLMRLQATLAEIGLRMAGVGAVAGPDFPEARRWRQLAELEKLYDAALAGPGLRDGQAAKLAAARQPARPAGLKKIIMLGTPDPLPLATQILARHAECMPVEILVCGPADEPVAGLFDEWGRPRPEAWTEREPAWPDFEQQVRLCPNPSAQADVIVALARSYASPEGALAIGVADPEILAPLEQGLNRAGVPVFNPEGRPRRHDGLHALLALLAEFGRGDTFAAAAALLRCPDILDWLARRAGPDFSRATLLGELDGLQARHLPPTCAAAREHGENYPVAARALAALAELPPALRQGKFPANVRGVLTELFAGRPYTSDSPGVESAAAWQQLADELAPALAQFPVPAQADCWELMLTRFAESVRFADKPPGALELHGWLELLWEDAPHLVVAGFNEGHVPDAVAGDIFLPEALRAKLGLKTNAQRLARDAYLLAALGARRSRSGRLDLLVGKVSAVGDPRRPSRLLLRCADTALPARIAFLFRNVATDQASLPWTRAWPLRPRWAPPPASLSVTAFRDYLACPFRYYLKHVLRMEGVDPAKAELDALDFGTLMHAALQSWGDNEVQRTSHDEALLRETLLATFEQKVRARYGAELTLPLLVQFESARQRLRQAAAVQAREAAAGWRLERVEWKFSFSLGGLPVRGKIDRIDRHADGRVRVLDYKTSDVSASPPAAHLGPVSAQEGVRPAWSRVMVNGKERAWLDLQLPLYRQAVAREFGPAVSCGYFNLPKAAGEAAVVLWENYDGDLQAAAERCAARIAAAVAAGEFWPPAEPNVRADADWAALFHHGTAASMVADWAKGGVR